MTKCPWKHCSSPLCTVSWRWDIRRFLIFFKTQFFWVFWKGKRQAHTSQSKKLNFKIIWTGFSADELWQIRKSRYFSQIWGKSEKWGFLNLKTGRNSFIALFDAIIVCISWKSSHIWDLKRGIPSKCSKYGKNYNFLDFFPPKFRHIS